MKQPLVVALALAGLTMPAFAQQSMPPPDQLPSPSPDAPSDPPEANAPRPGVAIENGTTGQGGGPRDLGEPDYDPNFDPTAREPRRNQPGVELLDDTTE